MIYQTPASTLGQSVMKFTRPTRRLAVRLIARYLDGANERTWGPITFSVWERESATIQWEGRKAWLITISMYYFDNWRAAEINAKVAKANYYLIRWVFKHLGKEAWMGWRIGPWVLTEDQTTTYLMIHGKVLAEWYAPRHRLKR